VQEGEQQVAAPRRGPHVSILGMGPSLRAFVELTRRLGGRGAYCDQVWAINALGNVYDCDKVFHMDDVRIQEIRAAARPDSNIARMLDWMKGHRGPIVTSRAHPEYPGLVEFPLADVVNDVPQAYFNSTAAYAVAYAVVVEKASKISCFGMDFTYPDAHQAEKGRACVEFWLGIAAARGVQVVVPQGSTLLDAIYPLVSTDRFYGYDCVSLAMTRNSEGRIEVGMTERSSLPTADEIEERYDHSAHPNALVES
jgi:hypothetical protein